MEKAYGLGVIVGRFQVFHKGHEDIIDQALLLCETVGVFIGSSQESGTGKNPFSYETRQSLLRKIYGNAIEIYPLPDIGVGNNATWGDYVLDQVKARFGRLPQLLISGKEARRKGWFDNQRGASIAELYIPKTVEISAEKMRELMIKGDFDTWKEFCDERLWDSFPQLRAEVLASRKNQETASL